jgi:hypothetical protein
MLFLCGYGYGEAACDESNFPDIDCTSPACEGSHTGTVNGESMVVTCDEVEVDCDLSNTPYSIDCNLDTCKDVLHTGHDENMNPVSEPWCRAENTFLSCLDNFDNDQDGKIDSEDAGCAAFSENTEQKCNPLTPIDEDGDGRFNCQDIDCAQTPVCKKNGLVLIKQSGPFSEAKNYYTNYLYSSAEGVCLNAYNKSCTTLYSNVFDCKDSFNDYATLALQSNPQIQPTVTVIALCNGTVENCNNNNYDDDNNGLADCADPACSNAQNCWQCTSNSDCGGSLPICKINIHKCVQCVEANDCLLTAAAITNNSAPYVCNNNKCVLSEAKCNVSCSISPECVRFPKCNVFGRAFLEIISDPGDWSDCKTMPAVGGSCDTACKNIGKSCVSSAVLTGDISQSFNECLDNHPCGANGEGYCTAPGEGNGTQLAAYDQATCSSGDGCIAVDPVTGQTCEQAVGHKDFDCGLATCAAGDGIVWGCSLRRCVADGSCSANFNGQTCSPKDPDCGNATCGAGNGCVNGCLPTDPDCKTKNPNSEFYMDPSCSSGDGCTARECNESYLPPYHSCGFLGEGASMNKACAIKDPDCGNATCAANNGCVLHCNTPDPDCETPPKDPDAGPYGAFEGKNYSNAAAMGAFVWAFTWPFTEINCGNTGDGCSAKSSTLNTTPITNGKCKDICGSAFCFAFNGTSLENEVNCNDTLTQGKCLCVTLPANATPSIGTALGLLKKNEAVCNNPDPDCGTATCAAGDGCVMACESPDPDCGTGLVCNSYSMLTDYSCNTPGSCQCWEKPDRDCNCCEVSTEYKAICYYAYVWNNTQQSKHVLFPKAFSSPLELLNDNVTLSDCCQNLPEVDYPNSLTIPKSWTTMDYEFYLQSNPLDVFKNVYLDHKQNHPNYNTSVLVTCAIGELCGDGIDNDGNEHTDCEDPQCYGEMSTFKLTQRMYCYYFGGYDPLTATCFAEEKPEINTTGMGSYVQDTPVEITAMCEPQELTCDDGVDNDGDGLADCADPDCLGKKGSQYWPTLGADCEYPSETLCYDGKDNDGDYTTLWFDQDISEWIEVKNVEGGIDCDDPDCKNNNIEVCSNNFDDDCDGLVDCLDPDCNGKKCSGSALNPKVCFNSTCKPLAQAGTAPVYLVPKINFVTYSSLLNFLHAGQVVTSDIPNTCNLICFQNNMICGFAEGGKATCSSPQSTKCTCYGKT